MARGIAFKLGSGIGKLVKAFLEANGCPPWNMITGWMPVDRVEVIDGDGLTFIDLLQAVIRANVKDLVLVVHGFLTGSGLVLKLAPGGDDCRGENLQTLMDIESGKTPTSTQRARLRLDDHTVRQLINVMRQVRAMRLNLIEWRSCDLGKKPQVLSQFARFFGTNVMGAPKMDNFFGVSPVHIRPFAQIPEKFQRDFLRFSYPDKTNPTVINFLKIDPTTQWPTDGALFAESRQAALDWIQSDINPRGQLGKELAIHGLWKLPDLNNPLADPIAILPLSSDYGKNILYVQFVVDPVFYSALL